MSGLFSVGYQGAYMDNGPLAKAEATGIFPAAVGVEIKTHEPESPSDTGKIEIKWRQLWRDFEAAEFSWISLE